MHSSNIKGLGSEAKFESRIVSGPLASIGRCYGSQIREGVANCPSLLIRAVSFWLSKLLPLAEHFVHCCNPLNVFGLEDGIHLFFPLLFFVSLADLLLHFLFVEHFHFAALLLSEVFQNSNGSESLRQFCFTFPIGSTEVEYGAHRESHSFFEHLSMSDIFLQRRLIPEEIERCEHVIVLLQLEALDDR